MARVTVDAATLFAVLNELSGRRALTCKESDMLVAAMNPGHITRRVRTQWTPKMERELARAATHDGGVKRYAEASRIPCAACYKRLSKIRQRQALRERKRTIAAVVG